MKTAHEFARELLAGPDIPVAVPSLFMADVANEPAVSARPMEDKNGGVVLVLVITAALTVKDAL